MTFEHNLPDTELHLSQKDVLLLSADIYMGAVDLATNLKMAGEKQKSTFELTVQRENIPLHAVPACWREVNQHLQSVIIQFSGLSGDERMDLELRSYFDNGWTNTLTKPALVAPDVPFTGKTREHRSTFGPMDQKFGRKYDAEASQDEITSFLSALIHDMAYQDTQAPLTDPLSAQQALTILDTVGQMTTSRVIRTDTYKLTHDGEEYLVDCELKDDDKVLSVDVCHVLADDIIIHDGEPVALHHFLVSSITFGAFEQGITFHFDSDEGLLMEDDISDEMLSSLRETIDGLNSAFVLPESPVMIVDSESEAAEQVRKQFRYGDQSPEIEPLDEDGLDPTDPGA